MVQMRRLIVAVVLGATGVAIVPLATAPVPASAALAPRIVDGNCRPAQLAVSLGTPQGTAGTIYYPIIFTDRGGACWVWGVPSIQPVVGKHHHPQGPTATNMSRGEMPARHRLVRGGAVSVGFGVAESGNYTPSACRARNASGVVVSLAPFTRATYVALRISVCTRLASTRTQLLAAGRTGA